MKARELRLMAAALGGLALMVASRGGESADKDAVTIDNPDVASIAVAAGEGDGGGSSLTDQLRDLAGARSVRLLDFTEIDQPGNTCTVGVEGAAPRTIGVSQGESRVLDSDLFTQLVVDNKVSYGDLNGDGRDEAVVHTVCAYGANGSQDKIQVWDLDSRGARPKATVGEPPASVTGPFPPAVKSVTINGGVVEVLWTHYRDGDYNCCPSLETRIRYQVTGDQLTAIGAPVTYAAS